MTTSTNGIAFLKRAEGFCAKAYPDAGGYSIGYGCFLATEADKQRYMGREITQGEAECLLRERLAPVERAVNAMVDVPLTQEEFDALVAFTYNVGVAAFAGSTLLRELNRGNTDAAVAQFARWNKSQGQVHPGLTARRAEEARLFRGELA